MSKNFYVYSSPWRYPNRDSHRVIDDWIYIKSALEYFCSGFFNNLLTRGKKFDKIRFRKKFQNFLILLKIQQTLTYI